MAQPHDNEARPSDRRRRIARGKATRQRSAMTPTPPSATGDADRGRADEVGENATHTQVRRRPRPGRARGGPSRGQSERAADAPHRDDVLAAIAASFDWLCTRPHPVCVDGRAVAGLPDALIPLDELRDRLTARACPLPVSDAVWAHLAARSRVDGGSWTVACAGMALPMLRRVVRGLTIRFAGDRGDIAAETVAGFLAALARIDLGGVALFASLRWAAYRAGLAAVHAALDAPIPLPDTSFTTAPTAGVDDADGAGGSESDHRELAGGWRGSFVSGPPPAVAGHPDLVLARAVRDGILSLAEAALIGSTRLEALSIADAAAARGQSVTAATVARHRAEHRLRRYLTPHPRPHPNPTSPPPPAPTIRGGAGPRATRAR